VEFRILGRLEVVDENGPVALGTLKERLVLAVLLLHANEVVTRDRLIDELWGESAPPTARKAINVYVSQLRKTLGRDGNDPITTEAGGYRLNVGADQLDATRMQQLLRTAREHAAAGEPDAASRLFREALELWRGPTLAGLNLESVGRHEIEQLEEQRLTALMDRIDCDLALGPPEQLIGELNLLVREHPLRERLRAQQMLALYRADRQADALDGYAEARRTLVDELGIEPSPALQRLQQGILRHDPSLETPTGTAAINGPAPPPPVQPSAPPSGAGEPGSRRRLRPRRWQLAAAAVVIFAASAAAAAILSTSAGGAPHVVPNSLVRLDPRTGSVVSVTPVGVEPGPIAVTPGAIWTANHGDRTISRYDLRTHSVQSRGGFPNQPFDIVVDADGNVWVSSKTPIVTRLAAGVGGTTAGPLYPSKTERIRAPGPGVGYETLGAGYVWATVGPLTIPGKDDRVSLIDLASKRVVASMRLGRAVTGIAFGYGAAWVGTFNESKDQSPSWKGPSWLDVIRGGARRAQSYRLETNDSTGPLAIAVGEGHVWVLTCGTCDFVSADQRLLEIDPDTAQVIKRIPLPHRQQAFLAAGAGSVWLTDQSDDTVIQLNPKTGRIVRTIPVGRPQYASTCGIAATNDAVWVAIGDTYCDTIGR
jgi:DNA-binding SARP family transcriptional activator/streptogramin lyase